MLIGYNENQEILYQTLYKNEESIFFGDKGFGLRLFKPIPDLSISNHIQSRRSYITKQTSGSKSSTLGEVL